MSDSNSLSRKQVRRVDEVAIHELGLPGIALMENAGRGAADLLLQQGKVGRVVICAAGGNNGGDGFVIARHLYLAGCQVSVWLFSPAKKLSGDALINYQVASRLHIPITEQAADEAGSRFDEELQQAEWIVDALFGTGLQTEVRAPYDQLIKRINASRTPVMAVDLPSGLDCDTGQPLGMAVKAKVTATFVAEKSGFSCPGAEEWTGRVEVLSIGVPWDLA